MKAGAALSAASLVLVACSKPGPPIEAQPRPPAAEQSETMPPARDEPTSAPPNRTADVTLKLEEPVELPGFSGRFMLKSFVAETVEPDPHDPDDAGGAGINLTILAGTQTVETYVNADPSAPSAVAWTDACRVEVVDYDDSVPSIGVAVDRITDETAEGSTRTLSLRVGETGDLGGVSMRFDGHSHKRTSPGQRSPLIVEVIYEPERAQIRDYVSLHPPEDSTWRWRDYQIRLVDWDYGERIDIEVQRLRLVPVGD